MIHIMVGMEAAYVVSPPPKPKQWLLHTLSLSNLSHHNWVVFVNWRLPPSLISPHIFHFFLSHFFHFILFFPFLHNNNNTIITTTLSSFFHFSLFFPSSGVEIGQKENKKTSWVLVLSLFFQLLFHWFSHRSTFFHFHLVSFFHFFILWSLYVLLRFKSY